MRVAFAIFGISVLLASHGWADELLPPSAPIEKAVDHYIQAKIDADKVLVAPQVDDATLIRRLTLDLCGRIPTVPETREFVESKDPAKRAKLVDRLIASPSFARYQASEFDIMLMRDATGGKGKSGNLYDYLQKALAENRPWDRVFRELIVPDDNDAKQKGSSEFLKARLTDLDKLTTEVSVLFFGVNVSCARCHDHPHVPDWKQDNFFGMKSFFARTFDNGGFIAERDYGLVKFQTTKGVNKDAKMLFISGKVVDAPGMKELSRDEERKEREPFEEAKKKKVAPPAPKYSARAAFVDTALQPEQRDLFAKAIVNRLWARLFGLGLVNPIDQMHSENPPSHPELLAWLARDTIERKYDLRRLIRGLVMSQAYSRSSRWESAGEQPLPKYFALARVRPLTPMQLATSLRIATTDPQTFKPRGESSSPAGADDFEKKIESLESTARSMASSFEYPGDDFQIGVGEALLFNNSDKVQRDLLADSNDRLLGRLKQLKDRKEIIETAMRSVLCREPTADEVKLLEAFLAKRADKMPDACRQLVWVLLTGSEFRFNY
jgi:hypothetical protein